MNPPETEELSENIEVVTPGDMLKEARVALKLSLTDVAKKLNLRESLIESIEANEFDELPSVTFTRGYLKGYAKLLNISEEDVLEAFEYLNTVEQNQLEMQSFSNRSSQKTADNWLSIVSILVVLVIITSAVIWWLQRQEPQEGTNTAQSQSIEQVAEQSPTSSDDEQNQQDQAQQNAETENNAVILQDDTQSAVADGSDGSSEDNNLEDAALADNSLEANQSIVAGTAEATEINQQAAFEQNDLSTAKDNPVNLSQLELRFSDSCWINVSDATGKRIAIGTKVKGHVTSVEGVAPFTIKLGKPDVVKVFLNGQERQIPFYPKGSVANFVLSENE